MLRYYLTPLLLLLVFPTLHADQGLSVFQEAMRAYKAGDYAQARAGFERAESLGMAKPALYYNLGVVYFQLEQWEKAFAAFRKTANYPKMAPLAYYNLGLVERRQNHIETAREWFERTLETSRDAKLSRLAEHALANLPRKRSSWNSFLSIGLGYDDNVALENDSLAVASEESDSFYELFGFTQGLLSGNHDEGVLFRGSLFGDFYAELSDYSLVELNLGLYKRFPMQAWTSEGGIYATSSTLGGDPYLSSGNLVFDTRRGITDGMTLRFRLRLKSIRALDSRSEGLEGSAFDLRTEGILAPDHAKWRIRSYYQLELNDRDDIETSTTFTSLSPTRHSLYLDYRRDLATDWQLKASGSYRRSRYGDDNVDSAGMTETRIDKRKSLALELNRRRIWRDLQLALEYRYTDNDSSIASYSYNRNSLLINLMKSFY
ncbi:MAG: tetratricopeptide repeat protein [Candidatus Thiodiazotropha sp.]